MSTLKVCMHCEEQKSPSQFRPFNHICDECLKEAGDQNIARPLTDKESQLIADYKAKNKVS